MEVKNHELEIFSLAIFQKKNMWLTVKQTKQENHKYPEKPVRSEDNKHVISYETRKWIKKWGKIDK